MEINEILWYSMSIDDLDVQQATRTTTRGRASGAWCPNVSPSMLSVM